jgi:hypothetical protein
MASVIDVYNLNDGEYKFSFYLHDFDKKKMKNFRVFDDKLVLLYDHFIVTYDLTQKYFASF